MGDSLSFMSGGSTVGQDWEGLPRSPPTSMRQLWVLAGFDPYSDNSPPSASSPSPLGKGSGIGGNAFQHRIPRTALYRWPAAPLPRNAVAANGGFVVLTIPQPTFGQSGRRKPPSRKVPAVLVRCCCGDRHPLTTHRRPGGMKGKKSRTGRQRGQPSRIPVASFRARSANAGRCLPDWENRI
jgi:hypothetical protein